MTSPPADWPADWRGFLREHMQTPEGALERSQYQASELVGSLTEDEVQILTRIVEGWGGRAIAATLGMKMSSYKAVLQQLMSKLNAECSSDLVRIGIYANLSL